MSSYEGRETAKGLSRAKVKSMIEAAGRYYGATTMGAPRRTQERLYDRARKVIPPQYWDSAFEEGERWWKAKGLYKGPGVDW